MAAASGLTFASASAIRAPSSQRTTSPCPSCEHQRCSDCKTEPVAAHMLPAVDSNHVTAVDACTPVHKEQIPTLAYTFTHPLLHCHLPTSPPASRLYTSSIEVPTEATSPPTASPTTLCHYEIHYPSFIFVPARPRLLLDEGYEVHHLRVTTLLPLLPSPSPTYVMSFRKYTTIRRYL